MTTTSAQMNGLGVTYECPYCNSVVLFSHRCPVLQTESPLRHVELPTGRQPGPHDHFSECGMCGTAAPVTRKVRTVKSDTVLDDTKYGLLITAAFPHHYCTHCGEHWLDDVCVRQHDSLIRHALSMDRRRLMDEVIALHDELKELKQ